MSIEDFIFTPSTWLGEGKISFSSSSEFIKFYTKWQITEESSGVLKAVQIVEMQEIADQVKNSFTFYDITSHSFSVLLNHSLMGPLSGKGIRNDKLIAWEFHHLPDFEGFEVYERQENGDFFLHAEYGAPDQFRTIVEGLIWKKNTFYEEGKNL